jgi:hypothetical protein
LEGDRKPGLGYTLRANEMRITFEKPKSKNIGEPYMGGGGEGTLKLNLTEKNLIVVE